MDSVGMANERAQRLLWQVGASAQKSTGFQYTTDDADRVFTREQREQYERDGFILVKKLVPQDKLDKYRDRLIEICDGKHRVPTMTVMKDVVQSGQSKIGEKMVTKIQDFQDDEVLFSYCREENILKYVAAFTGPNIRALHTMLIQKPPQIGKTVRHQRVIDELDLLT
jgi:phytanoyl-CoA hydroxylase